MKKMSLYWITDFDNNHWKLPKSLRHYSWLSNKMFHTFNNILRIFYGIMFMYLHSLIKHHILVHPVPLYRSIFSPLNHKRGKFKTLKSSLLWSQRSVPNERFTDTEAAHFRVIILTQQFEYMQLRLEMRVDRVL